MIDATGQRANETGWTKDAIRAQKKAKAKADRAAFARGLGAAWDFFLRNLLLWLSVAALVSIAAWEWFNTSRGWANLYPSAGGFIYAGAIGAVALYFYAFRRWRENGRAGKQKEAWISLSVALSAWLVCVAGVWIATATASEHARAVAESSRKELNGLKLKREELAAKVELNDPELFKLALEADQRKLKALVDTAMGTHGLPDLDVREPSDPVDKHGCPAPPKKFMIDRLCVQANGGIDPFNGEVTEGLRTEIKRDEKRLKDAEESKADLDKLDAQIKAYPIIQGDETANALGQMFQGQGGAALSWLLLGLSSLFLYGGGWLGDWVFERLEQIRAANRTAKAGP